MRKSKFTEEQVVALLREAEKAEKPIEALCREKGISAQTFYRWRKKYGGVETKDLKRMRELERENARLKRLVGEQALDISLLKELNAKNGERSATQGWRGFSPVEGCAAAAVRSTPRPEPQCPAV